MSQAQGVMVGVVKSVDDPQGQGRIQVDLPTMPGRTRTAWAPVASLMAGGGRGAWFMPELEDEVVVAFLGSDPEQPIIMGFTWNGQDEPPTQHPRERIIRSLNGHTIRLIDAPPGANGSGSITIEDANGNIISMSNGKIHLKAVALIEIEAPVITLQGPGWRRVVSPVGTPI
jgi:phage baseplate assembly protein V